jgi:hypothetical protein
MDQLGHATDGETQPTFKIEWNTCDQTAALKKSQNTDVAFERTQ